MPYVRPGNERVFGWSISAATAATISTSKIRTAAIRLSQGYRETAVVTLSLLGRTDGESDLELIFVCFREDSDRRNFRARYEGKFVPDK